MQIQYTSSLMAIGFISQVFLLPVSAQAQERNGFIRNVTTNKCLTIPESTGDRVVDAEVRSCSRSRRNTGADRQIFNVVIVGDNLSVRTPDGNKCLNLKASTDNREGGVVKFAGCSAHPDQLWTIVDAAAGSSTQLRNVSSGKCLNVHAGLDNREGGRVTVYSCANTDDQRLNLVRQGPLGKPGTNIEFPSTVRLPSVALSPISVDRSRSTHTARAIGRITQREMNNIETAGLGGLQTYTLREFISKGAYPGRPAASTKMVAFEKLRGTQRVRDLSTLRSAKFGGTYLYGDQFGNIVRRTSFQRGGEVSLDVYFTYHPDGSMTFDVDGDRDGNIDFRFGGISDARRGFSRDWILTSKFGEQLFNCLRRGAAITPDLLSGMHRVSVTGGGMLCPGGGTGSNGSNSSSGGGGSGGLLPPLGMIGEPDCSTSPGRGPGQVMEGEDEGAPDTDVDADATETDDDSEEAPDLSPEAAARNFFEQDQQAQNILRDPPPFQSATPSLFREVIDVAKVIFSHIDITPLKSTVFSRDDLPDAGDLIRQQEARRRREADNPQPGANNGGSQPRPNPEGGNPSGFQDPRCRPAPGINADVYTCGVSSDLSACITGLTDPVFNATGGNCRITEGQAGGKDFVCHSNDTRGQRACSTEGGNVCPDVCLPNARTPGCVDTPVDGSAGEYLDITAIGPVIGGLCHVDDPRCLGGGDPFNTLKSIPIGNN